MVRQPNTAKAHSKASLILTIVLAFMLIAGAILLVSRLPDDDAWQWPEKEGTQAQGMTPGFALEVSEAQQLYPLADGLIQVTHERIACLDMLGSERWGQAVSFQAPFVVTNRAWLLVADRENGHYVMATPEGVAYTGSLEHPIAGSAIGPDGMVALIQEREASTGVVTLLEAQTGRLLFDCYFPESGYVLSVAFSDPEPVFDVVLANTDMTGVQMLVKRFDYGGQLIGQLMPQDQALLPLLVPGSDGQIYLIGSDRILACRYDRTEPDWTVALGHVAAAHADPDGLLVLAADKPHAPISLLHISRQGTVKTISPVGEHVQGISRSTAYLAIGSGAEVQVIDLKKERVHQAYAVSSDVVRLLFAGPDDLTVVTQNGVQRIHLG